MKAARFAGILLAMSLLSTDVANAESKWSFKKLVPTFGKKDDVPKGLYPESNEPSMFRKMNNGTKAFFAKTKDAIPSWLMPETQDRVKRSSASFKNGSERVKGEVREARRNIFAPWGRSTDKADGPETVPDFLSQDRPE